jgi:23S rRNA (adenine2503-C2)-methyltransferase
MSADTNLMPIPGAVDPVPVARAAKPRADGRQELVGLSKDQIRALFEEAGLEPKQAKLRAKQVWHWIYNRGVIDFDRMSDIAKAQRPWFAEHFVISRPEVVEAQVSSDGTRCRPRDPVRVEPGRVHAQLPLLPHRNDAAGPQP